MELSPIKEDMGANTGMDMDMGMGMGMGMGMVTVQNRTLLIIRMIVF